MNNKNNKILIKSKLISLSSEDSIFSNNSDNCLIGKIIVCDFDLNKNGVMLTKDEDSIKTMDGMPLVCKVIVDENGEYNFDGHNVYLEFKKDEEGNIIPHYRFDTQAIGFLYNTQIENIDEVDYITANVKIWKRFEEACSVIERLFSKSDLFSSWELEITEGEYKITDGQQIKVANKWNFLGHCLLGGDANKTEPAYDSAKMLEVSQLDQNEQDLIKAITNDMNNLVKNNVNIKEIIQSTVKETLEQSKMMTIEKMDKIIDDKNKTGKKSNSEQSELENIINENEGGYNNMAEEKNKKEVSSLTNNDLYDKLREAINASDTQKYYYISYVFPYEYKVYAYNWDSADTDFVEFAYTVNSDDTVSITSRKDVKLQFMPVSDIQDQLAEKDKKISELEESLSTKEQELSEKIDSITKIGEQLAEKENVIKTKEEEIASLAPFKEKVEQAEAEAKEQELAEKKEQLKVLATKSGFITVEELETSETLKKAIEDLDEKTIKAEIADRVIAKAEKEMAEKLEKEVEVSETKEVPSLKVNIESTIETKEDPISIIKNFINN